MCLAFGVFLFCECKRQSLLQVNLSLPFLKNTSLEFSSACVTMRMGQDLQEGIKALIQSDDLLDS